MNDVQTLLARCREMGAEFFPAPDGKLKVRAPTPLPEELRAALKQHKAEVLTLLAEDSPVWPCPDCRSRVYFDPRNEHLPTRFWTCSACHAWGAAREGAFFPVVWVSTKAVQ